MVDEQQPGQNRNMSPPPKSVAILNTPVHMVTMGDTLQLARQYMAQDRLHQIATTNPEFVMRAQADEEFRQVLEACDLCIADGFGLVFASRWLGVPLPERVPGSELVYNLARLAAQEGWSLFLLGAAPGVAEQAASIFQNRYPGLLIAGTHAGTPNPAENDAIVQMINKSEADILFVAYGAPNQDKWIARNRQTLRGVRLALGVGGSLDFVTGKSKRAPRWMQNIGLEWLHRLIMEPWRWRRMTALPQFAVKILFSQDG